jgi:ammonia channel protein AmtB
LNALSSSFKKSCDGGPLPISFEKAFNSKVCSLHPVQLLFWTGWVYPCVSHWAWAETGWLAVLGYKDFAGSGVVHILGGTCALVACVLIGPRLQRFDKDGKAVDMPGHSVPLAGLGGFILLFGFLAFNGGSQVRITTKLLFI